MEYENRYTNGKIKESEKRVAQTFLPHSILPLLDCSKERTPILLMLWGCVCNKGVKEDPTQEQG
jgi:hypothetical protein